MNNNYKYIHLLYVPTMACNMKCKYCYLEDNTVDDCTKYRPLEMYGDENRTKQRHIATHQVYKGVLDNGNKNNEYYIYDIKNMIDQYKNEYSSDSPNNIFFTTTSLRNYHYVKQKNNAYYHIQAINLPFQNIEFYYLDKEMKK